MALTLKQVEDVLVAQVQTSSGLASGRVVLADQNFRPPTGDVDYLILRVGAAYPVGGPPGVSWNYDAGRVAGQEIELLTEAVAELSIAMEAFSAATENGAGGGDATALARLALLLMDLKSDDVQEALNEAGVGIFDFGAPAAVPRVYGAATEGRATLDMRAYVVLAAPPKYTGYIATAEMTGTFTP